VEFKLGKRKNCENRSSFTEVITKKNKIVCFFLKRGVHVCLINVSCILVINIIYTVLLFTQLATSINLKLYKLLF